MREQFIIFTCDRCKVQTQQAYADISDTPTVPTEKGWMQVAAFHNHYALCSDCQQSLREWMKTDHAT